MPQPAGAAGLLMLNRRFADSIGLDATHLGADDAADFFAGNQIPDGAQPLAQAYAGHQYGHFTGLGDGRAILLGEHLTPDGQRLDIQLKGAGRTSFSRGGDGRAALGPMLREYLISEAMAALGIPTSRSLAVATTGETVMRDRAMPGAVLTRVAASHIRIGTFQWAAANQDLPALKALLVHTANRHYPEIDATDACAFFAAAVQRQIALVVEWMRVGFVHGVMNTDNVALSGETIDYGPCAFIDAYDPDAVFSSIDRVGRYAYANQPSITRWNLARLAESLLPLFDDDRAAGADFANQILGQFENGFQTRWLIMMRSKLGLLTEESDDAKLIQDLLDCMHRSELDFTNTFRALAGVIDPETPDHPLDALADWLPEWRARLTRQPHPPQEILGVMNASNPAVIPRNHLVEEALNAAEAGDLQPFHQLLEAVSNPHQLPEDPLFLNSPPPGSPKCITFCGT